MNLFIRSLMFLLLGSAVMAQSTAPDNKLVKQLRAEAEKQEQNGNWKDALKSYKELLSNEANTGEKLAQDFDHAVVCQINLGQLEDFDATVETAVAKHPKEWNLLAAAGWAYQNAQHGGTIIDNKFERGKYNGGKQVTSDDRDRVRGLQLLEQAALILADPATDAPNDKKASFFQSFAQTISARESWELQALTDITVLPDYEDGRPGMWRGRGYPGYYPGRTSSRGAPVDEKGNPVFHATPADWKSAKSDGERWRWLLAQWGGTGKEAAILAEKSFADFLRQEFDVQTIAQWWRPATDESGDQKEESILSVHTLKEDETTARLAIGIKRFNLPEEYNFIAILKRQAEMLDSPLHAYTAASDLGSVFENRRQYERAVEIYTAAKNLKVSNDYKASMQGRIDQIVKNWGRFDASLIQPAGTGAKLGYVFRNGTKAHFTAKKIDVKALLADVKKYISSNPENLEYQRIQIQQIGYSILQKEMSKYIGKEVANWDVDLKPREHHWDRRIEITTPLQAAGAYFVESKMEGGNKVGVIAWISDTAIVKRKGVNEEQYYVVDAVTGAPIAKANLEFFGYRGESIKQTKQTGRRYQNIITRNFAEFTDAEGQLFTTKENLPDGYQWLITATTEDGRFAHLGFTNVWYQQQSPDFFEQTKIHTITDRPVYRPGQAVKFKGWVRRAKYDAPMDKSEFANQKFTVRITDGKGEKCFEKELTTDEFGGMADEFTLKEDANLGNYAIRFTSSGPGIHQQGSFRVEEYKKPEYEVKVDAPTEPVMLGEKISAKVTAKYYFGAPVVNAKVKYKVERSSHDSRWFPSRPWDWFYGPGYWWFAYDYAWYPGWRSWGCMGPVWWWWARQADPPELVVENEAAIGPDGTVNIEFDTAIAKEIHGDEDHRYQISVELTDESRRTILGSGQVLVARQPFKVHVWTDRGHYQVAQPIEIGVKAQTLDQKGVKGDGKWSLLQLSYNEKGEPVEKEIKSEAFKTSDSGDMTIKLSASEPGQYRLLAKVTDGKQRTIEGAYIFVVRGQQTDGRDFRFSQLELVPEKAEYAPGEEVKLMVNTDQRNSTVYFFVRSSSGIGGHPQVLKLPGKSIAQSVKVEVGDMPNFFIEAFTVSGGKVHTAVREIVVPPAKRVLNLEVLADNSKHKPQDKAKVKLKLTDLDGKPFQGSTVVTVYDKSLEYISGGSNVPNIKEYFWKWRRHYALRSEDNLTMQFPGLNSPQDSVGMNNLGVFGGDIADMNGFGKDYGIRSRSGGGMMGNGFGGGVGRSMMTKSGAGVLAAPMSTAAPAAEGMAMADAAPAKFKMEGKSNAAGDKAGQGAADDGGAEQQVMVRSAFADAVYWTATLNTNAEGIAEIEVPLPDNLTTWKIKSWGMGHGTRVGEGETEIITSKDIIIRQQAPRFFVEKDEVVLSANVHNYLPVTKEMKVTLELEGNNLEALPGQSLEQSFSLESMKEKRVDCRVKVVKEGTAVVRMKAVTDGDGDAMQMSYPVYVHGMLKTDSYSGAIRPEATSGKVDINVPNERRPDQSRIEVRYSPTIATAILDAIPYLAQYPHGCTEQTLNRFLPAVLAHKTLGDLGIDLKAVQAKLTNLNPQEIGDAKKRAEQWKHLVSPDEHPVFNEKKYTKIVKQGVEKLTAMQNGDGGWGWFYGDREESYPHTTAVVVHGLLAAKKAGLAIIPGVVERGVAWLKRHEAHEVERIKRWPKWDHSKEKADEMDSFIHMVMTEAGAPNEAMRDFLYRDRNDLEVYAKATFGYALDLQGQKEKRDMLLQNIEQYLVVDKENQTARLDLRNGNFYWWWYGSEFEAEAFYLKLLVRVDPKSEKASGLVKYLINNRKNSTYWHSTRDTAYVIEALNDYILATKEVDPDVTVQVLLDGQVKKEVKITKENLFTFDNALILEGKDVPAGKHTIEIKKQGNSPIYFNAYVTNFTLEDRITKAGLEVKVERRYYKLTERKDAKALVSGARGQAVNQKVLKYDREVIADGQSLKSGDLVEVELVLESKNDYEYLLFEDIKPAGFEAVEVRSGFVYEGMSAYREFHDERVSFYLRTLPLGKHSITYRLKAEIPGKFSALPAKASAMYAPELRGNSDEMKLGVTD